MSERRSVWLDDMTPPGSPLEEAEQCDVVVVGGGITGITTAVLLRQEGQDVVLLEADRLGSGTTGGTTGKLTSQHGLIYVDLMARHGREIARQYAELNQHAIDLIEELVDQSVADCGFTRASSFVYDESGEDTSKLREELEVALDLGLPARLTEETGLPFQVASALEYQDQAYFHPVRYCRALAAEFVRLGGRLYERSRVVSLREAESSLDIRTERGSVEARHAVVATLLPVVDRGGFFAKTKPNRAYGIAARLGIEAPSGMYLSSSQPVRSLRPWREGGPGGVVIVGESHETGDVAATPERWGDLEQWANQRFPVESFEYRWSAQDYHTADRIPYLGRSPLNKSVLVATGFAKWGLTNGTAAASLLTDTVMGRGEVPEGFAAGRIGDAAAVADLIKTNASVAADLVKGKAGRLVVPSVDELERGEAAIVDASGTTVAAYRDAKGLIHAVRPSCTHLGCDVRWNDAEISWDCPCHGSRFGIDGSVLAGPATEPLEPFDVHRDQMDT